MVELPEYLNDIDRCVSDELMETLASIESCFQHLTYDKHIDQLNEVFAHDMDLPIRELCDEALQVYRIHIDAVLKDQGIVLINPLNEKIPKLEQVLRAITLLGTRPLDDILEGTEIEDADEGGEIYLANLISHIAEVPAPEILLLIDSVSPDTVRLLEPKDEGEREPNPLAKIAETRFKAEVGECKEGLVCNMIRRIGAYGYDLQTFSNELADEIEILVTDEEVIREVRLLLLGSSELTEDLVIKGNELIEFIFDNPMRIMKLNAKLGEFGA